MMTINSDVGFGRPSPTLLRTWSTHCPAATQVFIQRTNWRALV